MERNTGAWRGGALSAPVPFWAAAVRPGKAQIQWWNGRSVLSLPVAPAGEAKAAAPARGADAGAALAAVDAGAPAEAERELVIGARCGLGGLKGAEPHAGGLVRVPNLGGPLAPGPLAHTAVPAARCSTCACVRLLAVDARCDGNPASARR